MTADSNEFSEIGSAPAMEDRSDSVMPLTIVYTSELTGVSVGRDKFGFHVIVDGVAMFGPLRSRIIAEELADTWGSRHPAS